MKQRLCKRLEHHWVALGDWVAILVFRNTSLNMGNSDICTISAVYWSE
jgi:hypothetical protein